MATGHGYKATYDYVELTVELRESDWCITLTDTRHGDSVEHDETYDTPADAKDAAIALAHHHIYVLHNDTLLLKQGVSWQEY
jgi:hypothetical protein